MVKYNRRQNILETTRLLLKVPSSEMAAEAAKLLNDIQVVKWMLVIPFPYSKKDALDFIGYVKKIERSKTKENYDFWLQLKTTKEIIGGIGLVRIDYSVGTGVVGYWLGRKYWRQGFGSEALAAILHLAFNELNLRRIEAGVFAGNPSSGKLLLKHGFKLEGRRRKACLCKATNKIHDEDLYGLLSSEYKRKGKTRAA